jgi:hypothetical protein
MIISLKIIFYIPNLHFHLHHLLHDRHPPFNCCNHLLINFIFIAKDSVFHLKHMVEDRLHSHQELVNP